MSNWSTIKPNDKLFMFVPYHDEYSDMVMYDIQETYIINLKYKNDDGISIKFKYTNYNGLRKKCYLFIPKNRYDVSTLSVNNYHFGMKPYKFGDIIISLDKHDLLHTLNTLINNKQKEIETLIKKQQSYLMLLDELKNKF